MTDCSGCLERSIGAGASPNVQRAVGPCMKELIRQGRARVWLSQLWNGLTVLGYPTFIPPCSTPHPAFSALGWKTGREGAEETVGRARAR